MYNIILKKAAVKFLKKQDKNTQIRILNAIKKLPDGSNIKNFMDMNCIVCE